MGKLGKPWVSHACTAAAWVDAWGRDNHTGLDGRSGQATHMLRTLRVDHSQIRQARHALLSRLLVRRRLNGRVGKRRVSSALGLRVLRRDVHVLRRPYGLLLVRAVGTGTGTLTRHASNRNSIGLGDGDRPGKAREGEGRQGGERRGAQRRRRGGRCSLMFDTVLGERRGESWGSRRGYPWTK